MKRPEGRKTTGWPLDVSALLALLAGLLILFQYVTLDKFGVLRPGLRYQSLQGFLSVVSRFVDLSTADVLLLILIFFVGMLLIGMEWRGRRLSVFFEHIFASERRTVVFLVSGSLILVRFYFAEGEFAHGADTYLHVTYAWLAATSMLQGEVPIWTHYFCNGTPYLQFYGFLFYYLVGLVNLVLQAPFSSIKFVLGAAHAVSGLGAYLFVRRLTGSRQAGVAAGLAYVLSFWHTQQVLIMGRLPLSLFYALLPLPFYYWEGLRNNPNRLAQAIGGGIALGCLHVTHPGYGFWATLFLLLYAFVRCRMTRSEDTPFSIRYGLLLFGGGALLGAYLTVPMYLERGLTGLHAGFYMSDFPMPTWRHLLLWSNYRFRLFQAQDHWYGGYLGVSLVAFALWGSVRIVRSGRAEVRAWGFPIGFCLIGSLLLVFGYRWPVLKSLGVVQAMNASRYLLFVVFFVAVLVGLFAAARAAGRKRPVRVFVAILVVVLADLGPTTFQQPYRSPGVASKIGPRALQDLRRDRNAWPVAKPLPLLHHPVYKRLGEELATYEVGQLPGYRLFHTTNRIYYHFIIPWLTLRTGLATPLDTFTQYPLSVPAFVRRFQDLLHLSLQRLEEGASLNEMQGFDIIRAGLFLMNTRHLLFSDSEQDRIFHEEFPEASPVVVSSKISGWSYPVLELDRSRARSGSDVDEREARRMQSLALSDFVKLLRAMDVDVRNRTCEQILVADEHVKEDLGTSPRVEVLAHRLWNQRVELVVRASAACFARLAYTAYPHQRITLNGGEVRPYTTAGRFVALKLGPGESRIVIEPTLSPLRFTLLIVDVVLLLAAAVILVGPRIARRISRNASG
ncbi:MAG: 6-pyruvoyl-tetrahydropterin synthase-related protein [Gemmatimonadota bacterium]|nr:6-pyruvoyl-tetrahydropterin synthase-related protein [Gemmatimonadota bacterium]